MAIQSYEFFSTGIPIHRESEREIEENMVEEQAFCSLIERIVEIQ
jgi:hypothetical protein